MVFWKAFRARSGSPFTNSDGNRNVPYLNWNGDERNLNANDFDNDWDSDNRFLVLRTSLQGTAPLSEELFRLYLFQPSADHFSHLVERH